MELPLRETDGWASSPLHWVEPPRAAPNSAMFHKNLRQRMGIGISLRSHFVSRGFFRSRQSCGKRCLFVRISDPWATQSGRLKVLTFTINSETFRVNSCFLESGLGSGSPQKSFRRCCCCFGQISVYCQYVTSSKDFVPAPSAPHRSCSTLGITSELRHRWVWVGVCVCAHAHAREVIKDKEPLRDEEKCDPADLDLLSLRSPHTINHSPAKKPPNGQTLKHADERQSEEEKQRVIFVSGRETLYNLWDFQFNNRPVPRSASLYPDLSE